MQTQVEASDRPTAVLASNPRPRAPPRPNDVLEEVGDHIHRLICCLCIVFQCGALDYYLIKWMGSTLHFIWIIGDAAILGVLAYCFIVTFLYKRGRPTSFLPYPNEGVLPYAYFVWLIYSSLLISRVGILFYHVAHKLPENIFFGQNMLRVTVALSAPIALFLVKALLLAKPFEHRTNIYLLRLSFEPILDVLDAVAFMEPLFSATYRTQLGAGIQDCIIAFGCITLFAPCVLMAVYSKNHFSDVMGTARCIKAFHLIIGSFLVNLPLLVIRLVLWHSFYIPVSAFLIKNLLFVYIFLLDIVKLIIYFPTRTGSISYEENMLPQMQQPGPTKSESKTEILRHDA